MNLTHMIAIMILAGFFSTMNVWVVDRNHVRLHLNDAYMVGLMISWMVLLMSLIDRSHSNPVVLVVSIVGIISFIYLIRTQTFIDDRQFLQGMIPHHSMAILMAERIKEKTQKPQIIALANEIIQAQKREINLMNRLL